MHTPTNLKASIKSTIKLVGSTLNENILKGSAQSYISLKGSVVTFLENLSIRGILTPIVALSAFATIYRNAKGLLTPVISMSVRGKTFKNAKGILTPVASLTATAKAFKNAKEILYIRPLIGKIRRLIELDGFALGGIDNEILMDLDIYEGLTATVRRNAKGIVEAFSELSADITMIQYTKLGDMDAFTLSTFDSDTLKTVQETTV